MLALRPLVLKAALIAAAASPALLEGGCALSGPRATGPKSATAAHAPGSPITVQTRNGSVQVIAESARSDVSIDATITCAGASQQEADQRLAQAGLDVSRDTSRCLTIQPTFPGGPRNGDGASLVVRVPDADGVHITSSNGSVSITGLSGAAEINTTNASVNIQDHHGPARIDTSNGSISVRTLEGDLRAATSNAAVSVSGLSGKPDIRTSNGRVELSLGPDESGPIDVQTSNGPVTVRVGLAFHGRVTLDTSNASVRFTGAPRVSTVSRSKSDAVIDVGEGGAPSRITTSNGTIDFKIE